MLQLILIFIVVCIVLYFLYKIGTKNYDYFAKQNIPHVKPYPFVGTNYTILGKNNLLDLIIGIYEKFPDAKIYGGFDFLTPVITIRDPEVLKRIAIKDFDHFTDHINFIDAAADDVFGNMLTVMRGKRWKDMRSSLSPAFTGNKMRLMYDLMINCSKQFVDYINEQYQSGYRKPYDIKDLLIKYTNNVVTTCAFGVECNSLKNPQNELFGVGQSLSKLQKPSSYFLLLLIKYFPKLANLLNLRILKTKTLKIFNGMIIETMNIREEKGIYRPDMINILMELKRNSTGSFDGSVGDAKQSWSESELMAQCFIFYFAGFETTSQLLTFTLYELAINQDIQNKLYEEIQSTKEMLNDETITYDVIQKMKYLDMVISEGLRKWPPAFITDRKCVKDYTYEDESGFTFSVKEGVMCLIPIIAYHRDPKFFENPDKFDPERFSEENKGKFNSAAYLPFGLGPRNCIGSRFALQETKLLLFYIISNFKIDVSEETQIPLQLKKSFLSLTPAKPIKLYIQPRK